jgi:glycosyltransferase involved in cell wall biosynthesis/ADP-heptose:LPS heptosyltransferase
MAGAGQRDVVLRPLARKPVVYAGLIVKNEERDLPRCLASLNGVVDAAVVVDTGSTDATLEVAAASRIPVFTQVYTGASRQDATGDWKLWDFGKARNVFVDEIERRGVDFVLWMDADDELLTPANLRRAIYWGEYDVFGVQIESSGQRWTHHRLWRAGRGIRFLGRCHEYPTIGGHRSLELMDSVIRHDAAPGVGESSNQRNLRILAEEFAEQPTPRTAFYLASTHRDGGRWREAADMFARRIAMGEGFRDEWLFAYLYRARCERASGDVAAAEGTLLEAASREPGWAEFWMELAYIAYDQKRYAHAIGYALRADDAPVPPTQLWRETNKYTDQPPRLISWCYEHEGDLVQALVWARRAAERIGTADPEWDARVQRLEAAVKPDTGSKWDAGTRRLDAPMKLDIGTRWDAQARRLEAADTELAIALHRPGAIGDILMTLNCVPALRAAHPGLAIHYFCAPAFGAALADVMHAAGVDVVADAADYSARAERYARAINLIGYPLHEGYPERPMRRHLLQYFAAEMGLPSDALEELSLPRPPRPAGLPERYATLQAQAGWSVYKNWPRTRWEAVLAACADIPVFQLGTSDEPRIAGARHDFLGTPLSTAVALVANATLHLGVDSFANHLTHYRWRAGEGALSRTRGVIVWGSTQASAAGYPHNVNISIGLPCQPCFREDPKLSRSPRGPCITPPGQTYDAPKHACLHGLPVERVLSEIRRAWNAAVQSPESLALTPSR